VVGRGEGWTRFGEGEGVSLGFRQYQADLTSDEGINNLFGYWDAPHGLADAGVGGLAPPGDRGGA
jgi:hypothetical protein